MKHNAAASAHNQKHSANSVAPTTAGKKASTTAESNSNSNNSPSLKVASILVALFVFAVHFALNRGLKGEFILDDKYVILGYLNGNNNSNNNNNTLVCDYASLLRRTAMTNPIQHGEQHLDYRQHSTYAPLSYAVLSFLMCPTLPFVAKPTEPNFSLHLLVNLLLHSISSGVLCFLTHRCLLLTLPAFSSSTTKTSTTTMTTTTTASSPSGTVLAISAFAAISFGLHPACVRCVYSALGVQFTLGAFLFLACLLSHTYTTTISANKRDPGYISPIPLVLSMTFLLLTPFALPSLLLPSLVLLLLFDVTMLCDAQYGALYRWVWVGTDRGHLWLYGFALRSLAAVVAWGIAGFTRYQCDESATTLAFRFDALSNPFDSLPSSLWAIVSRLFYTAKHTLLSLVVPVPNSPLPAGSSSVSPITTTLDIRILSVLLFVLFVLLAFRHLFIKSRGYKRNHVAMFGFLMSTLGYLPLSGWIGFMDVVLAAEAWYVPLIGAILAASAIAAKIFTRSQAQRNEFPVLIGVAVVIVALLVASLTQHIAAYKSDETLFSTALKFEKDNGKVHYLLARSIQNADDSRSEQHFASAVASEPCAVVIAYEYGSLLYGQDKIDQALSVWQNAIRETRTKPSVSGDRNVLVRTYTEVLEGLGRLSELGTFLEAEDLSKHASKQ
eukprot:c10529_g1_i2.p1 GENE.c10529_g1_i2~~c10529_g1_i2.p1  ORF type:complete len:702 (-),score=182.49 c10529_g1_i2:1092-3095(-)